MTRAFVCWTLLAWFVPVEVAGQSRPRPLALEDYYRIETASGSAISPDGRRVAFVRNYIVEAENRRQSEIWLAATDGSGEPRRLTHPSFNSAAPRWSPDGSLLAFRSQRRVPAEPEGRSGVWFLRMDSPGEAFQIPGVEGTPLFSPDNQWIAFTKATPPESSRPRAPASEIEARIAERFKGRMYDWMNYRFDGRGYLRDPRDPYETPPEELYVVPRSGGDARQLTRLGVNVQEAAWRPDGRALALIADAHQRDEYTYERADLWIVELEGDVRRLTDDGHNHSAPAWSPDGRWLVVRRQLGLNAVIAAGQSRGAPVDLFRIAAAGGTPENLTASWDLLPGAPSVSPDGRFVYFQAQVGGSDHLFRVPLSGGEVEQVTRGARSLSGFTFDADYRRMAYVATDPTHPSEAFAASIDGSGERRLSRLNDALLSTVALQPAVRVSYNSTDGTPIEGWVMLPASTAAGLRAPLILAIHGGPHSAYGHDFSFQFQLWAARGYGVLYTNPRGSTGYGEDFLWATWGGWGRKDSEDVLAGVDHVLSRYPLDPGRLAVTGYSYGGFLTNWIITHSQRFAAAVSGAGIANWVSDYGTADIPRTKESEFYGPPWEERSGRLLVELSPVMHASAAVTPTLFVHGESDFRVPIEQGEQMYVALKKRRVPAAFVRYPDMYHGNWTPWNTVHRYYQELKWWEKWLDGGRAAEERPTTGPVRR
ncbi:MAG TPA: S9 family peptidase [Gemmatimonadales bacterium]|nr:S9 family peptidase [Gemmatimonadales bacterium]